MKAQSKMPGLWERPLLRLLVALAGAGAMGFVVLRVWATPPVGFQNQMWIVNLDQPTAIAFTPDGRMFIAERTGKIKIVQPGATQVDATPLLTITNINTAEGERGLVGLTLDPHFTINGYYYVFYTANTPLRDRVSRFTVSGNATVPGSEVVIWQDNVDAHFWHHGGGLAFGPDGKLYISIGDHFDTTAGAGHASQRLDSYHGKLLRLNSDGSIPPDNPFVDGAGPNLDAIWAIGLRNPFRITVEASTGRLLIGDVGGNLANSVEELNLGAAGANYGWPICEGSCSVAGMTNPIFSYSHAGNDASIIAGFVYSGTLFPAEYLGSFFYGDYSQRWIRRLTFDAAGNVIGQYNFEPADGALYGPYGDIVDLKQGPDGALYYADIALDMSATPRGPGSVRRISYSANNHPPVIESLSANPLTGPGPTLTVTFSATASDVDADPLIYQWNFGDGFTATLATVTHTYTTYGAYVARLMVSDGRAQTLSDPVDILVGIPPVVTLTAPLSGTLFRAGEVISYRGSASDDATPLTPTDLLWTVLFRHEGHVHPAAGPITGTSGTFTIPVDGHDFSGETAYEFILSVTDGDGLSSRASTIIYPDKATVTLQTEPSGLLVNFDQLTDVATPFAIDSLIGFQHTIAAPLTQTLAGITYTFASWSDGGAAAHLITVPTNDQTYVARYSPALCGASHCVYVPLVTRYVPALCGASQCIYLPLVKRQQ